MRKLIIILLMVATSLQAAEHAKPIVGKELLEFLGPVSPRAFRWTKHTLIDFELYNGEAMPPLSGHVGFYLGGHADFKRPVGSTTLKSQLGIFPVTWYRSVRKDGTIGQDALVQLDDYWQVDIGVSAKRQKDLDQVIAAIAQLPLFTKKPKPAFGPNPSEHPW